ncbi:MAG TPA: metallophosphoesterase [Candidatus Polarisedimenticolia bacterium]|nr:metallophosphoesterase [Candidatus Polarisedimenticolia bacterium]
MSTLKVAHASDLHCCERNRLDDWIALHQVLVDQVASAGCKLALLTGDLFHAKSTPAERNAMAGFLQKLAEICPVAIIKGNHDAAGDLDIFGQLEAPHPIAVLTRVTTSEDPLVYEGYDFSVGNGKPDDVTVIALPWFDKAHLVAGLDPTVDAEASRNLTIETAQQMLTLLRAQATAARSRGELPILAGHVLVAGSETSTGQTLIGTTVELSPADLLEVGAEYAALGHIHLPQEWHGGRVAYAGSTWAQNFGEDHPHGWRLVTFEDGRFVSSVLQELPSRRIVLLEADCTEGILSVDDSSVRTGDLVRYRYRVRPEDLATVDEDAIVRALLAQGAAAVKLEAVIVQEARVRSEAIVTATSSWEKVEAYLSAKGIEIDEPTRARIREKLAAIEARQATESEVAA